MTLDEAIRHAERDKGKCKGWNVVRIGNNDDMRGDENEIGDN